MWGGHSCPPLLLLMLRSPLKRCFVPYSGKASGGSDRTILTVYRLDGYDFVR